MIAASTRLLRGMGQGLRREAWMDPDLDEPCGGERILDFALCLIVSACVVGPLLLAL
ncbi:hypothetical protein MMB17_08090 [Methylobacterium organophilum]|uniref:hypothetical protein n=1 Tax=Methylobacterium organophilum TaxID=410 RepID=UPI001F137CD6|nr:hypothetical protein [Methylobacterium organophilum]UMY19249.1 hypothetical protein MMB17_08090 [Methylobacterium organophilum]